MSFGSDLYTNTHIDPMPLSPRDGSPASTTPAAARDSPLLSLPPEIRIAIYELVCSSIDKALIKVVHKPHGLSGLQSVLRDPQPRFAAKWQALSLTCRQVRAEMRASLAAADPRSARVLVWQVKNFDVGACGDTYAMEDFLRGLVHLRDGKRTLVRRISLDNSFDLDQCCRDLQLHCALDREFAQEKEMSAVEIRTCIRFDSNTFDVSRLKECLQREELNGMGLLCRLRKPMLEALEGVGAE